MNEQEANRARDVLVAMHVMGWRVLTMGVYRDQDCGGFDVCVDCTDGLADYSYLNIPRDQWPEPHQHDGEQPCYQDGNIWRVVPEFSTRIEDAWRVVERMRSLGWYCTLIARADGTGYDADFERASGSYDLAVAGATDAPMAVALAALKALGIDADAEAVQHAC